MKRKIILLMLPLLALNQFYFLAPVPQAQAATAICSPYTVYGQVTDGTLPVDSANVVLTNTTTGSFLQTTTAQGGFYIVETANLNPCLAIGNNITVEATSAALSGSQSFVYNGTGAIIQVDIVMTATPPVDTTAPVITILGNNPETVTVGSVYTDAGATSLDNVDGNLTASIMVTNNVNTDVVGAYTVDYMVTDAAGNMAMASRTVNVIAQTPVLTSIAITPAQASIAVGGMQTFSAAALDQYGAPLATQPTFTWASSNTALATVDAMGMAMGVAAGGPVTITATSGAISGTANLTVTPVSPLIIIPGDQTVTVGSTLNFTITTSGGAGSVTFSVTGLPAGASFDTVTGAFVWTPTAADIGMHSVTFGATDGTNSAAPVSINITVNDVPVLTTITVSPASASIAVGGMQTFVATALDQHGAPLATQPTFTWTSSDTAVATIDAMGMASGVTAGGPVTITATSGAISGTASLTITATPPVDVVPPVITILGNNPETVTVGSVYTDAGATALDNVDGNLTASIITTNNVNAALAGTYTVGYSVSDAAGNTATASRTVNVILPASALTTIVVSHPNASLAAGATEQFTAVTLDQFGVPITATVTWTSSDPTIVTIDPASGLATAVAAGGPVTITATSGAIFGTAALNVAAAAPVPVLTGIVVTHTAGSVLVGTTEQFTATAYDQFGVPLVTQPTFAWASSDPTIASVDPVSGLATAIAAGGPVSITASSGAVSGSASLIIIDVAPVPVLTTIVVNHLTGLVAVGVTEQFTATALDQFGVPLAPQPAFTWSSGDPAVVSIDPASGLATAVVAGGPVTITATANTISGSASLTVTAGASVPVLTSIIVSHTNNPVAVGGTEQFTATALDQFGVPIVVTVSWTSSDPTIASIDPASGLATAVAAGGPVTITATSAAISGAASLTVTAASLVPILTSITVAPAQASITAGASQTFTATALDQFGVALSIQPTFTWSSNNSSIATIDNTGVASGVVAGVAVTITATSGAISGTASLTVAAATPPARPVSGGGGGGGGATILGTNAYNSPLVVNPNAPGTLTMRFANGSSVLVQVPQGAVDSLTTFSAAIGQLTDDLKPVSGFNAALVGANFFSITAKDASGRNITKLLKPISIIITMPGLPSDTGSLGAYYFNESDNAWMLIANTIFNVGSSVVTLGIDHLTRFAVFQAENRPATLTVNGTAHQPEPTQASQTSPAVTPLTPQVLGISVYGDGTLIRASGDTKIYIIINGQKKHITTLKELRKYAGQEIIKVAPEELNQYQSYAAKKVTVVTNAKIVNGSLIRDAAMRIFVIKNGKRVYVPNLEELMKYAGQKINDLEDERVYQYPSA